MKDLYEELGTSAEIFFENNPDEIMIVGGNSPSSIPASNGLRCLLDGNNIVNCDIDVTNVGGCTGNRIGGGPRTCPYSV
ncbi:MAG: hypothetical protein J1F67_09760 [Muribaculaceae bacterium]|nr:hypothetical protein [Muribaculaceae bacterium]